MRTPYFWTRTPLIGAKARERSRTTRLRVDGGGIKNMPRKIGQRMLGGSCPLPVLMQPRRNLHLQQKLHQWQEGGRQLPLLLRQTRRDPKMLHTLVSVLLENLKSRILRRPLEARNARKPIVLNPLLPRLPQLVANVYLHPNMFSNLNPQSSDANNPTLSPLSRPYPLLIPTVIPQPQSQSRNPTHSLLPQMEMQGRHPQNLSRKLMVLLQRP